MTDKERYEKITSKLKELNLKTIGFTFEYFIENKPKCYTNINIIFECPECGDEFIRVYSNIIKNDRRKICLKCCKKLKKTNLLSIDTVRDNIAKKGLKLISTDYTGETCSIKVMCACGIEYYTTYASIRNSGKTDGICRCSECAKEYSRDYFRMSFDDIVKYFESEGCKLLSTEENYINIFSEFAFIAKCGHRHTSTFQSFKNSVHKLCSECVKSIHCGENAYNWNGGYNSESIRFRKTYEFKKWNKDVFKRDNYTCQCCKYRGGRLNSHHLNGYNWDIKNRTNIENGVALCEDCHRDFHDKYGYGDNTKEQFIEWIKLFRIEEGLGITEII